MRCAREICIKSTGQPFPQKLVLVTSYPVPSRDGFFYHYHCHGALFFGLETLVYYSFQWPRRLLFYYFFFFYDCLSMYVCECVLYKREKDRWQKIYPDLNICDIFRLTTGIYCQGWDFIYTCNIFLFFAAGYANPILLKFDIII